MVALMAIAFCLIMALALIPAFFTGPFGWVGWFWLFVGLWLKFFGKEKSDEEEN